MHSVTCIAPVNIAVVKYCRYSKKLGKRYYIENPENFSSPFSEQEKGKMLLYGN